MKSLKTEVTIYQTCVSCKEKRLKSHYASPRARICMPCKMQRNRSFSYKGVLCNRGCVKLIGNEGLVTYYYKSGHRQLLSLKNALDYVREGRARIMGADSIEELMDFDELVEHVRVREDASCQLCGNPGLFAEMIVPKNRGGKKTPINMHFLCKECKRKLNGELLREEKKSNVIGFIPHDKTKKIERNINKKLSVYCDCSLYQPQLYGVGIVIVDDRKTTAQPEMFRLEAPANSVFGELLAIRFALNVLVENDMRARVNRQRVVTIYSDISYIDSLLQSGVNHQVYGDMVRKIHDLLLLFTVIYSKTTVKIKYIGRQRNSYYQLAHRTARTWIRNQNRESSPLYQIL